MSEPFWTPLGGQPVDYEGAWQAGVQYAPGDVVVYNGIDYLAVNPSLGVVPPSAAHGPAIGTSFPASPIDGQVFTLVDSVANPTWAWRFMYVAAKPSNKWVFVGGAPASVLTDASETTAGTAYGNLSGGATGPSFTIPVAGDYIIEVSAGSSVTNGAVVYMSPEIGATPASDTDAASFTASAAGWWFSVTRLLKKAGLAAGTVLTMKYRTTANTATFRGRVLMVTPIAVGG